MECGRVLSNDDDDDVVGDDVRIRKDWPQRLVHSSHTRRPAGVLPPVLYRYVVWKAAHTA